MRSLTVVCILTLGAAAAAAGCTVDAVDESAAAGTEVNAAPAGETELQLAKKAVTLIAGNDAHCTSCHTAGRDDIRRWGAAMAAVEADCLSPDLGLTAAERIACLRDAPEEAASGTSATKLGLYSAAAALPVFADLFREAYGEEAWQARYDAFKRSAAMPAFGGEGLTAAEFATVKRWVLAGLPKLDEVLDEPGAFPCETKITPELLAHMGRMKNEGWGARLAAASTPMAGCGTSTDPLECLGSYPDVTSRWGTPGTAQRLREVRALSFRTSFWVRSSPDGRFAAFGGSPSRILDLAAPESAPPVTVAAPYDPGFFPNNDGFSYAGTQAGGLRACRQSVLLAALDSPQRRITFSEPGCSHIISTVYQSVGAALDGSLFFMATGAHTNDAGGASGPLSASFGANATTTLTPMYNDGSRYVPGPHIKVVIPHEGDQQMSPSNTLLITRFGQRAGTAGFRVRTVTPRFTNGAGGASSALSVDTKAIGTVCLAGGKPQMSFDERFLVVHQYVDRNANPDALPVGTSNIFVIDLATGKSVQVTTMGAGQRALFPHFRADGWIYFLVKDSNVGKEYLLASDAILHLAKADAAR